MPNPRIPTGLKPVIAGYSVVAPDGVSMVAVGGGMPRLGRDWDNGFQQFSVSMVMTAEAFSVWSVFYHRVLRNGTLPLDMPIDSGLGLADHACQILPGSYSAARAGGQVSAVSFSVLAQAGAYALTDLEVQAILDDWEGGTYTVLPTPRAPRDMCPVIMGYQIGAPDGVVGADIGGGLPTAAAQWERGPQPFQLGLVLAADAFRAWSVFFHRIARNGSLQFTLPLDSGLGTEDHVCMVVPGSYSATRNGQTWQANFAVVAESMAHQFSDADAASMLALWEYAGTESDELLARIARFANVDTLVLQP